MAVGDWFRPPRSVLTIFLAGAATVMACLTWLAVRQLDSDELAEQQRTQQRLAAAADRIASRLQAGLAELDRALSGDAARMPDGGIVVSGDAESVTVERGVLPFVPVGPPSLEVPDDLFAPVESVEATDPARAAALYRTLAESPSRDVRARALVGLGRTLRKFGKHSEAIEAYAALASLSGVAIESRPVSLVARLATCRVHRESGESITSESEARALRADLARGKWPVTGAVWRAMYDAANECGGAVVNLNEDDRRAAGLADALEEFWLNRPAGRVSGQAFINSEAGQALVAWRTKEGWTRAVAMDPGWLEALWRPIASEADVSLALLDREGGRVLGGVGPDAVSVAATVTGLPWTIAVSDANPDLALRAVAGRRRTFMVGLLAVGLLIVGSGYFTFRGIRRELAIARMHADFVSAASHEFRTPLTSIRQLSHMLQDGRVEGDERRGKYYDVLVRESERMHRLVERLLSFGRADAGRVHAESLDARDLAAAVASEFKQRLADRAIDVDQPDAPCPVRVDREMLSLALWNLLDNAVKYSPVGSPVRLRVLEEDGLVTLAVRDHGAGIPPEDRRRIFEQFVRGADTASSGTPGSGLGLALVDRIVRAHGGEVRIDSEVGRGSLFTIALPKEARA